MNSSALTSKGQVTIPKKIRQQLGLKPGDQVAFIFENGQAMLFRKQNNIEAAFGIGKPKRSASLQDIESAIRKRGSQNGRS